MQDGFYIGKQYIGGSELEISKETFEELFQAKRIIWDIIEIEDLFTLIALSYFEFEQTISNYTLQYLIGTYPHDDTEELFRDISDNLNLKILTLLNAVQAYQDQLPQRLKSIQGKLPEIKAKAKLSFNEAYDSSFEYRLMETLRNFSQHNRLPLGGTTISTANLSREAKLSSDTPSRLRVTLNPYFSAKKLLEDGRINKKIRMEILKRDVDKIDAKLFIRLYISKIYECHKLIKDCTEDLLDECIRAC